MSPQELFNDLIGFCLDEAVYQGADDARIDFRKLYGRYDSRLGRKLVRQLEQSTQLQAEILVAAARINDALNRQVDRVTSDLARRYGPR